MPTPGLATVRHVWDKRETYRLAERVSLPIPRTWFPRDESGLADVIVRVVGELLEMHQIFGCHGRSGCPRPKAR